MLKKGGSTLRPRFKTRMGVIVKVKIQDKKNVKANIQDKRGATKGVNFNIKVKI
jgi:hypothetical protein